jgi:shikimate kinase
LFHTRDPLYREAAHYVVETGRPNVASLVNMIVSQLELAGHISAAPPVGRPRVSPPHGV